MLFLVTFMSACGSSPTSPDSTTTTTAADASISEDFDGVLPVGGSRFYSFTVTQYGTLNITLDGVGGSFVPSTVMLQLGVGVPDGADCTLSSSTTTAAGTTPQITNTYSPGIYCVRVADVGNLFAPATFSVVIAHS